MPVPRILIVDDQRDITRMLRAALETLGRGYVIVDVPSAEEALLEMRRGLVDLLITDLRLPGISGIELIRRLRKASTDAAMIVISAYADEQAQADIIGLGATFYSKPLSLAAFLQGVQHALANRVIADAPEPAAALEESAGILDRLTRLRRDLGAVSVLLVDRSGEVAVRAGDTAALDLNPVVPPLVTAFSAAVEVCKGLGGLGHNTVQFFDGRDYDLYAANVGADLALVILFAGERGAGQMGPVLRYGRQAADDVLQLISRLGLDGRSVTSSTLQALRSTPYDPSAAGLPVARPGVTAPLVSATAKTGPLPTPPPAKRLGTDELKALDAAVQQSAKQDASSFWDQSAGDIGDVRADTLSFDQAAKLGLIDKENKK
jgi:CheY-like chemotaxis protein